MSKQAKQPTPAQETIRVVPVDVGDSGHISAAVFNVLLTEHTRRGQRIKDLLDTFSQISGTRVFATTIARLKRESRVYTWDLCLYLCGLLNAKVEVSAPRTVRVLFMARP